MTQYLFRGKKESDKQWIEGSLIQWPDGKTEIAVHGAKPGSLVKYAVISETVGQWNFRKDREGQRIFEGDIIQKTCFNGEDYEFIAVVKFDGEGFCLERNNTIYAFGSYDDAKGHYSKELVCGNIYDNPELLNPKTEE